MLSAQRTSKSKLISELTMLAELPFSIQHRARVEYPDGTPVSARTQIEFISRSWRMRRDFIHHWENLPWEFRDHVRRDLSTTRVSEWREYLSSLRTPLKFVTLSYYLGAAICSVADVAEKRLAEEEKKAIALADDLRSNPEQQSQISESREAFAQGNFVRLTAEQIRDRRW